MPLIDAFRLREPAHPPAVWLVPRWWAFSRDDRYRIGVVNDRGGVRSSSSPRPMYSTNGQRSIDGVAAKQQKESPKKQQFLPRTTGEESLSLNPASANTHSYAKEVVPGRPQSREARPSEAAQALTPMHNAITPCRYRNYDEQDMGQTRPSSTKQANHRSHFPTHQHLRFLPTRQKKGQIQRRTQQASDLPKHARLMDHETSRQIVKLNDPKSILKSNVPAEMTLTQTSAVIHQHEQPTSSHAHLIQHEDDTICVNTTAEQQRDSIRIFLDGQRDHHQHPWSKHTYPLSGSIIGKELSMMPITAAHHLIEPDVIESRTIHLNPTVSTPTSHTCAHLPSFPSYQVPDHDCTDAKEKSQPLVEDSGCPLHETPLNESLRFPSRGHPSTYNQAYEFLFHAPHQPKIDHHLHQSPTNEMHMCPHYVRDDAYQHDHDHRHAQYKLASPYLPSHQIPRQGHINVRQTQNHRLDHQICHPGYEHNDLRPHFDMLPRNHIMHENQYSNLHSYHQDPPNRHNHHRHQNDQEFPTVCLSNQPARHDETMNQPDPRGQDGCGQAECFGCGYNRGRRTSYVRTRGGERDGNACRK